MSESENVRQIADLKSKLEKRLKELEEDVADLKVMISIIDSQLFEKSFKRAETIAPTPAPQAPVAPSVAPPTPVTVLQPPVAIPTEFREVIPLRDKEGRLLGNLQVSDDVAKIVAGEGIVLNVNTPPFQSFLITRVLEAIAARDREEVEAGKASAGKAFGYKVVQDGDRLKEIILWNYRDQARLREVRSSARWTFERMLEKG